MVAGTIDSIDGYKFCWALVSDTSPLHRVLAQSPTAPETDGSVTGSDTLNSGVRGNGIDPGRETVHERVPAADDSSDDNSTCDDAHIGRPDQ